MDKKKAKDLRKKLDSKILKLIAPKGMSVAEYKIQCNLNGIDATLENGMFLIDSDSQEQCEYFCDAVKHLLLRDKDYSTRILDAVLKNYKNSSKYGLEVFNFCKQLNKAFGLTSTEYFDHDGFKDALLEMRKNA